MDIGCGKARVIAYLLGRSFPGKLNGIELNHDVAEYAKSWTEKYENFLLLRGMPLNKTLIPTIYFFWADHLRLSSFRNL